MVDKDSMLDSSKRVRLLTMLLVISVVLILVLSCTSIAYYEQSENHDAEYKGQYKLVEFVDFSIINMCMEIEMTTNHSYNLTTRYQSGQNAQSASTNCLCPVRLSETCTHLKARETRLSGHLSTLLLQRASRAHICSRRCGGI